MNAGPRQAVERRAVPAGRRLRDFVGLTKPRVMSLAVFTALVGMVMAPGSLPPAAAALSALAIALGAGGAGALNMWYDAGIDAKMARTARRALPAGRVRPAEALALGLGLSALAVLALGYVANWLAAGLLAFTIFFYVVIYTVWLKRATPQNIVIGGAAGALPPVIGWAAVAGEVGTVPLLLFLIIFLWTPPHFWSLALLKTRDYAAAGIPMMPNVAGEAATRRQILFYALLLVPVSLLPWAVGATGAAYVVGATGAAYAVAAALLGGVFVLRAWRLARAEAAEAARAPARALFAWSILYLLLIFAALLIDAALGGPVPG